MLDHRIGTPESVDDTAMRTARIAVLLLAVALLAVGFGQSVDGVALARGSDTASELETERFHRNEPKVYRVKRTTPRHDDRPRKLRGEVVYKGPKFLAHLFTPRSPPDEEDEE